MDDYADEASSVASTLSPASMSRQLNPLTTFTSASMATTVNKAKARATRRGSKSKHGSVRWQRGEVIGQGAFGTVYLGLNLGSGELMAVKQLGSTTVGSKELVALENEIKMLKNFEHPNIVRYLGTERKDDTLSIFLEYIPGGSIRNMLDRFGSLDESVTRLYTRQLLLGLEYLHRNGIAHRDIKGANVLVSNDGTVKLADFGASKKVHGLSNKTGTGTGVKGTPFDGTRGDSRAAHRDRLEARRYMERGMHSDRNGNGKAAVVAVLKSSDSYVPHCLPGRATPRYLAAFLITAVAFFKCASREIPTTDPTLVASFFILLRAKRSNRQIHRFRFVRALPMDPGGGLNHCPSAESTPGKKRSLPQRFHLATYRLHLAGQRLLISAQRWLQIKGP